MPEVAAAKAAEVTATHRVDASGDTTRSFRTPLARMVPRVMGAGGVRARFSQADASDVLYFERVWAVSPTG